MADGDLAPRSAVAATPISLSVRLDGIDSRILAGNTRGVGEPLIRTASIPYPCAAPVW